MSVKIRRYFDKSIFTVYTGTPPFRATTVHAFDLDSTLIETRTGKIHSIDADDYQWCTGVLSKLKEVSREGLIVIFSNQSGISTNGKKLLSLTTKLTNLLKELQAELIDVDRVIFFMAAKYDWNRKPSPGMWNLFVGKFNGVVPDTAMYVGDAAGRPTDFACSDRKFARNIGIKFYTPEQYFQGKPEKEDFEWGGYDPQGILKFPGAHQAPHFVPAGVEMIVCVGYPGAGKSTWFESSGCRGAGYVHVNQDTLGTLPRCLAACRTALAAKQSVYIDNTNLSVATRAKYIDIAKKMKVPVRCVWFNSSLELCKHLNRCRSYLKKITAVPHVAYANAVKAFVAPSVDEGFKEVIEVPFVPNFAEGSRELRVFKYRW